MRLLLVILLLCVPCIPGGVTSSIAEQPKVGDAPPIQGGKASQYRDRALKRMKYNKCYHEGKAECYKEFREAVVWCKKHWKICFPLIEGAGAHASNFGSQILRQCRKALRERCRREAGM